MSPFCGRSGPPWWPAGEPWPPRHHGFGPHHHARARFFRRIAVVVLLLLLLAVFGATTLVWILMTESGMTGWAGALPLGLLAIALLIVVGGARGAMRHFASPLNAVMEAADRVAGGDYAVRVKDEGPPPMRALAYSFNTMTERLQQADRQRRDLMADLAHELRTPLSVLQGRLEGLIDGVYPRDEAQLTQLLDETQVLARLIEDLRTLALSDAGALDLHKESTDLASLVHDVARNFDTEATSKSIALNMAAPDSDVVIDVDPVRIREVLTNLLSNALRHTPNNGTITVTVRSTDAAIVIDVKDSGPGIPADQVSRMFDRFYKGPGSRGSGLGLAIAKQLITAHGGEIAASSQPGQGTNVTVTLPRQPA